MDTTDESEDLADEDREDPLDMMMVMNVMQTPERDATPEKYSSRHCFPLCVELVVDTISPLYLSPRRHGRKVTVIWCDGAVMSIR